MRERLSLFILLLTGTMLMGRGAIEGVTTASESSQDAPRAPRSVSDERTKRSVQSKSVTDAHSTQWIGIPGIGEGRDTEFLFMRRR